MGWFPPTIHLMNLFEKMLFIWLKNFSPCHLPSSFSTKFPQKGSICGEMMGAKVIAVS
jgi:hypothetical protein